MATKRTTKKKPARAPSKARGATAKAPPDMHPARAANQEQPRSTNHPKDGVGHPFDGAAIAGRDVRTQTRATWQDDYDNVDLMPRAPVFVKWNAGVYKLALWTRAGKSDDSVFVRVVKIDTGGAYVPEFGDEIEVKRELVSRVFSERDWESVAFDDDVSRHDARLSRGPVTDASLRDRDDVANVRARRDGGHDADVYDVDTALDVAIQLVDGRPLTARTLAEVGRWVQHSVRLLEDWKKKYDTFEESFEERVRGMVAMEVRGERELAADPTGQTTSGPRAPIAPDVDLVIEVIGDDPARPGLWHRAIVTKVDVQKGRFAFKVSDKKTSTIGSVGSERVDEEGRRWRRVGDGSNVVIPPHGVKNGAGRTFPPVEVRVGDIIAFPLGGGKFDYARVTVTHEDRFEYQLATGLTGERDVKLETYEDRANGTGRDWCFADDDGEAKFAAQSNVDADVAPARSKPLDAVPEKFDDQLDVKLPTTPSRARRANLPKPGDAIDVDGMGTCTVDTCERGYVAFHAADGTKGRRRTSDQSWRNAGEATPSTPANATPKFERQTLSVSIPVAGELISVRVGSTWETVRVTGYDQPADLITFEATDVPGVFGSCKPRDRDRTWRELSSAERARSAKPVGADVARKVEAQRADVVEQANDAARGAVGDARATQRVRKKSPVDQAVADSRKIDHARVMPKKDHVIAIMVRATGKWTPTKVSKVYDEFSFAVPPGRALSIEDHGVEWIHLHEIPRDANVERTRPLDATEQRAVETFVESSSVSSTGGVMSLHKRNVLHARKLGITLDEVVRRREAGTLALLPEDYEANAEANRAADRARAGLDDRGNAIRDAMAGGSMTPIQDANADAHYTSVDPDELAVASDRELESLGKRRLPSGEIIDWTRDPWEPEPEREPGIMVNGQPDHHDPNVLDPETGMMFDGTPDDGYVSDGRMPWD